MKDLITLARIEDLRTELISLEMVDESGKPKLHILKTPTQRHGNETLALVRCKDHATVGFIYSLSSVEVLGEAVNKEYVFKSDEAKDKYEQLRGVGGHYTPQYYADENGDEHEIFKPYMFGLFA